MSAYINYVPLPTFDSLNIRHVSQYPSRGLDSLDVGENRFFERELQFIIPELSMFEYGRISARNVIPIERRGGPAAEVVRFRQITRTGLAKIISDYSQDIPYANAFGEEFTGNVRSIVAKAGWSVQEIRAGALAGVAIDREKSEAAREAMLRQENTIAWNGDAAHGLVGVMTDANIPRTTVPDGASTDPEWDTKTGAEIVADLNLLVNTIPNTTNQVEQPDTVLLPPAQYHLALTTRMETGTDTTALKFFVDNSPYIKSMDNVLSVAELVGAGAGGVDVAIAYERNLRKIAMNIPLDIEQFAPQVRDLMTDVIYHQRFGGVQVKKPLSVHIIEAI